ncbi:pilus assembly protein PilY [Geomonas sp.]|uniref:pilus assembly protein n=1 Tax=Geomonas sp. TaxID=2651584 RepID=UPI002B49A0C0|nr:pilus assembly protein PilY [Geomonas sp.]HJV33763.1 pilus assembly protein PilY [Geomonas sp.]
MLDNSASAEDLAYSDTGGFICSGTTTRSCSANADCPSGESCISRPPYYCYDESYSDTNSYLGYFDRNSYYNYDFSYPGGGRFVAVASLPTSCVAGGGYCPALTGYLYLQMTDAASPSTVQTFMARGNFLNWLTTSRLDLEKQALTGGKFLPDGSGATSGMLIGETRGCQGRKFVKVAAGLPQLTFAVSGPIPASTIKTCVIDYLPSPGGLTQIEIYDNQYRTGPCMAAARGWQTGNVSTAAVNDALACLTVPPAESHDDGKGGSITSVSDNQLFVQAMTYCAKTNGPISKVDAANACGPNLHYLHGGKPQTIPRNSADAVCGSGGTDYNHVPVGFDTKGFLGIKYVDGSISGSITSPTELDHYCADLPKQVLVGPSFGVGVPDFIPDLGMYNLGMRGSYTPVSTPVSKTLYARIAVGSPPSGILQEYANELNFGAMIFNNNGALTECTDLGYTNCSNLGFLDGGKVVFPVGSSLGDHTSGLISYIDQMAGTSWSPLAETFYEAIGYFANRTDLRFNSADYGTTTPRLSCQSNNVLIVSNGVSTADRNANVNSLVSNAAQQSLSGNYGMPSSMTTKAGDSVPTLDGSYNLDDLAWIARHKNINDPSFTQPPVYNKDYLTTYVLYNGAPCGSYDSNGNCTTKDEGVPEKLMQLTASNGGGKLARIQNFADLEHSFHLMLQEIAAGSGSDPCIASTGVGNGAISMREQFFPSRSLDNGQTTIKWSGELSSLWYYIDPFIGIDAGSGSALREDSDGNGKLTLKDDKIVSIRFADTSNKSWAYLTSDSNGDGICDGPESQLEVDQVKYLWQAGKQLWSRDLTVLPRTIYTPLLPGGTAVGGAAMMKFSSGSQEAITPYLHLQAGDPDPGKLISYLHGFDPGDPTMRSRTLAKDGIPASTADSLKGVGVWKLGDVISSTPQVQWRVPLGRYHLSPGGYGDLSYAAFIGSSYYGKRGTVYLGANDGMLHAFNFGNLDTTSNRDLKATVTASGGDLGSERWAFIPKNALPYLKYLANLNYRHLYYVDGKLTVLDASIGNNAGCTGSYWNCLKPKSATFDPAENTWKTVLVGGMGLGGASCGAGAGCVAPPLADPSTGGSWVGYSSYFALDVTDQNNPILLWEFSNPALGYTTTGPAMVRIGDRNANGRWFAVFGSGPTGPVDTVAHQFLGQSSQELKLFVVDLRTGELVATIPTGIMNAFAGAMGGGVIDVDRNYQDDALYVGYSQMSSGGTWGGGVLRLITGEKIDPSQWQVSKVIDGVGPVTSGIARLQDTRNHNLWLYFGTGRYFFSQDDMSDRRSLYGIKEPCYNIRKDGEVLTYDKLDANCRASVSGELIDQTTTIHSVAAAGLTDAGWRVDLEAAHDGVGAERVLTTPIPTTAGAAFFSTFQPSTDSCQFGNSYLWGMRYVTAGPIQDPVLPDLNLKGKALVQLSNGGVREIDLATTFANRKGDGATGLPAGLKLVTNAGLKPLKKIIHIQER